MGSGVGFASSTNQVKAARAKKQRKAAAVPQTPAIKLAVEEFRAKVQLARDEVAQRISIGEMVTARHYTSGGATRQQFADVGIVKVINREMRKDFRTGKVQPHNRVTVLVDGKRYDVLEAMLEPAYAHEPAPAPKPSPLPEKVEVVDVVPLLLPAMTQTHLEWRKKQTIRKRRQFNKLPEVRIKSGAVIELPANCATIAGYLPSCIEKNYRTVAMVQRQSIRRQYEAEKGVKLPEWKPLDLGQKWEWKNVPGKGWEKVKVS